MTAVFVHGVPETPAVWHGLLAALERPDTVALSLPGFDSARPAGFGATMEEYAGWLAAQLERLGNPVDLVGHDWGGGFVVRVVSTRPELVRSWVTDAAGIGDAEFEWHEFAKIWQTRVGDNRDRNGTRPILSRANDLQGSDLRKRRSLVFLTNALTCDDAGQWHTAAYLAALTTFGALTCGNVDR